MRTADQKRINNEASKRSIAKRRSTPEGEALYRLKVRELNTKRRATKEGRKAASEASSKSIAKKRSTQAGAHDLRMATMFNTYGLTEVEFQDKMTAQQGGCEICGKDLAASDKRAAIDHDHATGKVRGLLCSTCNTRLGYFETLVPYKKQVKIYLGLKDSGRTYNGKQAALQYKAANPKTHCEICGRSSRLIVDHDHTTGHIRGLLCYTCNSALGVIETGSLDRYTEYLEKYSA